MRHLGGELGISPAFVPRPIQVRRICHGRLGPRRVLGALAMAVTAATVVQKRCPQGAKTHDGGPS